MKTTIRMVADYAGVSRGTVDRVLHNRGNVKPDVLIKVRQALKELEYSPNAAGRALAFSSNAKKLGFLLPDQPGFFFDEVMRGIRQTEEENRDLGIQVCVKTCSLEAPEAFVAAIDEMVADGVCGFAVCAQNSPQLVDKINHLSTSQIPVITVNSDIPESARSCFIGEDAVKSGQVAAGIVMKYLKVPKEILIVAGNPNFSAHRNRVSGFTSYLNERGITEERCRVVYTCGSNQKTREEVSRMLQEHPGIESVYMAIDSIQGFADALMTAPPNRHLFTVCHDTDEGTLNLLQQGVIDFTIDQDLFSQGYRPLQMLIGHVLHEKPISGINDKISYHIVSAECIE